VARIGWTNKRPDASRVGEEVAAKLVPLLERMIPADGDGTTIVILERPWGGTYNRSSIVLPLYSLYNCVVLWLRLNYPRTVRIRDYGPSIKKSLYGFDTSNKDELVAWATALMQSAPASLVDLETMARFSHERKKDDMADALFLVCHQLCVDGVLTKGALLNPVLTAGRLAEGRPSSSPRK